MTKTERKVHEPLFHISKRDAVSWKRALLIRVITVIGAFLFSGLLSWWLIGVDPFTFIAKLFDGVFSRETRIWVALRNLSVLLCIALALAPAFKMRFWNIGAEGQVLMGGLATAICMYYLGDVLPEPVVWLFMIVAGIAAGALWAIIPAIFKAFWNTNETLFTLMMNYIAMQLVSFFTNVWVKDGSGTLKNETHLHGIMLPQIAGENYLLPIIVVALLTAGMFVYLKYSKHGYELSVVGESENTARYVGINVKKVIIRTMAVSGAICGVAGLLLTGAINGTVTTATAGGQGFTAIIVSWLGKFNPLYMILTSFLVVFLDRGMVPLNLTNDAFSAIITGIVFFIIIGCEFFLSYQIKRRHEKKEQAAAAETVPGRPEDGTEEMRQTVRADADQTKCAREGVTAAEGARTEEGAVAVQAAQSSEEENKADEGQTKAPEDQTPEEEDAALLRKIVGKTGEAFKKGADAVADTAKKCAQKVKEGAQRCKAFLSAKFRKKDKPQDGEESAATPAKTDGTDKTGGEDKAE